MTTHVNLQHDAQTIGRHGDNDREPHYDHRFDHVTDQCLRLTRGEQRILHHLQHKASHLSLSVVHVSVIIGAIPQLQDILLYTIIQLIRMEKES